MTPDAEAMLVERLASFDADIDIWQVGGGIPYGDDPRLVWESVIQVDVRAGSKAEAAALARQIITTCLTLADTETTTVTGSSIDTGPLWLPDTDGTPRYSTTLRLALRMRRSTT